MLVWNAEARGEMDNFVRSPRQRPAVRRILLTKAPNLLALLFLLLTPCTARAADCIPIHEAGEHVGETKCITGKVVRVNVGPKGVHFLDFCEDAIACPFTVAVFSHDLKDVGDVRRLAGRRIEIRGAVKVYDGRPEIILRRISQIEGGAAMIPPLPKNYDVENRATIARAGYIPQRSRRKQNPRPVRQRLTGMTSKRTPSSPFQLV